MSSTAVPVAPAIDAVLADLARQAHRLRIAAWVAGGAGLVLTASLANIMGDAGWAWTGAAIGVLATFFGYAAAARPLRRHSPLLLPSAGTSGFATAASPLSHAQTAVLLVAAGFALGSGTTWTALALVLLAVAASLRPQRLVVTPSALLVRRLRTRSVPWAQLTEVRVTTSAGSDQLSLAVDRPGRPPGTVRIALSALDVDRAFLLHLLHHYRAVPEDRTAIGAPAELGRRRAAYLSTAAAPAVPVIIAAQAASPAEPGAGVIDPGADPGALPVPALP